MFSRFPPAFFLLDDPSVHNRAHAWLLDRQNRPQAGVKSVMREVFNEVAKCTSHSYTTSIRKGRRVKVTCVFLGDTHELLSRKGHYAYLTPGDVANIRDYAHRTMEKECRWRTIPKGYGLNCQCEQFDTLALMSAPGVPPLLFRRCRYTFATDWVRPSQETLRLLNLVLRAAESEGSDSFPW